MEMGKCSTNGTWLLVMNFLKYSIIGFWRLDRRFSRLSMKTNSVFYRVNLIFLSKLCRDWQEQCIHHYSYLLIRYSRHSSCLST